MNVQVVQETSDGSNGLLDTMLQGKVKGKPQGKMKRVLQAKLKGKLQAVHIGVKRHLCLSLIDVKV